MTPARSRHGPRLWPTEKNYRWITRQDWGRLHTPTLAEQSFDAVFQAYWDRGLYWWLYWNPQNPTEDAIWQCPGWDAPESPDEDEDEHMVR